MSSLKLMCEEYFGSYNFYEILNIKSDASDKEIKKAYHKLSLLVHPDRVAEDQKKIATKKFQVLGKIHLILQDKAKRKLYDEIGEFDEEIDSFNWMDYWLSMFKKIEIKDIENHEKEYIGSETELRDIKKAYVSSKGNMDKILEMVPFSNCDSEPRIIDIVQKMVDNHEIQKFKSFFHENKQKKMRRHKKWEREKKETESVDIRELERDMEKGMKERAEKFGQFLSNIEGKYGNKQKRKSITDGRLTNKRSKSDVK